MGCGPFPASCGGVCDCTCSLVGVLEDSADECYVDTSVRLVYRCDGSDYDQDLDAYGVMVRVTGDDGILWEGPASELPAQFTATVSDGFELYAWVTLDPGSYVPGCSDVASITLTHTVSPTCKTCPPRIDCECLEGDWVPVGDATVTLAGTAVVKPYTAPQCISPPTSCGDLTGTYVVPCGTTWYGVHTFLCTSAGQYYYYMVKMVVANSRSGVTAELSSGIRTSGTALTTGAVVTGSGTGAGIGSAQLLSTRDADIHPCDNGSLFNLYKCSLVAQSDSVGTAPTANGCDMTGMTVTISR